jgi:catechol 2,3-dioxygenase-like lactoylglutathione lyase family enzyme
MKSEGVLHFTIPVKDLDRSEAFYTDILGLEKIRRNNHMVFMRTGDHYLVLTYSERPIDPNVGDAHDIHHAFRVSGSAYDEAKAFLASKGVRIFKEEQRTHGTFQGRSAYFHDPDRNVIEIMDLQRPPLSDKDEAAGPAKP